MADSTNTNNTISKITGFPLGLGSKVGTDLGHFFGIKGPYETKYKIEDVELDIIGDEKITLENDVTDNFVETNVAYQDQISVKPIVYTISGEVGELVYRKNDNDNSILAALPDKLGFVSSLVPKTTKKVNQVRNKLIKVANFVSSIDNFIGRMANLFGSSDFQSKAFQRLVKLRDERTPIAIQCPWGLLDGYVITKLEFLQKGDTTEKTYITISFKEIRTTSLYPAKFDETKYNGIEKQMRNPLKEAGQTNGNEISFNKNMLKKNFTPDMLRR